MTVAELIEELKRYPQNLEVKTEHETDDPSSDYDGYVEDEITDVRFDSYTNQILIHTN